jgi:hypothetical protein
MLAYKDGERVRLVSRNGGDHTRRFADPAAAIAKLPARTLVLDGAHMVFDLMFRDRRDLAGLPLSAWRIAPGGCRRRRRSRSADPAPGLERARRLGPSRREWVRRLRRQGRGRRAGAGRRGGG